MTGPAVPEGRSPDKDRNLLFGVFAVQLHLVTPDQFVQAAAAWVADPADSLGQRFVDADILTPDQHDLVQKLVDAALAHHGADAARALNTFGGEETLVSIIHLGTISDDGNRLATRLGLPAALEISDELGAHAMRETPGRYTQRSEFSRGGMGRILLVHDAYLARDIALKELLPDRIGSSAPTVADESPMAYSGRMVARFLREAKITGQLEHPNIVPVYELGQRENGSFYYTMKLVRGETFARRLRNSTGLRDRLSLLPHFLDLCNAVGYAHSRKVIHRDIKPANVLVGAFGETVVIDWGLAKIVGMEDPIEDALRTSIDDLHDQESVDDFQTQTGVQLGTPAYMSPEQARGEIPDVDERSDVFSLGVVLYEMLTGRTPYEGKGVSEIISRIASSEPIPIEEDARAANPELAEICRKALSKEKRDRYQNAGDLAQDIERYLSGLLVQAYSYSSWELWKRFYRRNRALVNLSAASAAALLIIGITAYLRVSAARDVAIAERERAERSEYITSIQLANSLIEQRRFDAANDTLLSTDPDRRGWEWGLLYNQCNADLATIEHGAPIVEGIFSHDGSVLATIVNDETVRVWDAESYELLHAMPDPRYRLADIEFSPDDERIAVAQAGVPVLLWTVGSEEVQELEGCLSAATHVAFHPDGSFLAATFDDGSLNVWDPGTGELMHQLSATGPALRDLQVSDSGLIAARDSEQNVRVWRVETAEGLVEINRFQGDGFLLRSDGSAIALINEIEASVVELATGAEQFRRRWHSPIHALAFGPENATLAMGAEDGTVLVSRIDDGTDWLQFDLDEPVAQLRFAPNDLGIVALSSTGVLVRWDLAPESIAEVFSNESADRAGFDLHSSRPLALTVSNKGKARIWNLRQSPVQVVGKFPSPIYQLSLSPGRDQLGVVASNEGLFILDTDRFSVRRSLRAVSVPGRWPMDWSPDGARIATAVDGFTVLVVDSEDFRLRSRFGATRGIFRTLKWNPVSDHIATAGDDRSVRVWDVERGQEVWSAEGHEDYVTALAWTTDGQLLASGARDGSIRVWHGDSGGTVHLLNTGGAPVSCLATDRPGYLFAGCDDGVLRQWRLTDGVQVRAFEGHRRAAVEVQAMMSNDRILSFSPGSGFSLWAYPEGESILAMNPKAKVGWTGLYLPQQDAVLVDTTNYALVLYRGLPEGARTLRADSPPEEFARVKATLLSNSVELTADDGPVHSRIFSTADHFASAVERVGSLAAPFDDDGTLSEDAAASLIGYGFLAGDKVVAVDGEPLGSDDPFSAAVQSLNADASVSLRVDTGDGTVARTITALEPLELQDTLTLTPDESKGFIMGQRYSIELNGAVLNRFSKVNAVALGETPPDGQMAGMWIFPSKEGTFEPFYKKAGIATGDRLIAIDGEPLTSLEQYTEALEAWHGEDGPQPGSSVTLRFQRGAFVFRELVVRVMDVV